MELQYIVINGKRLIARPFLLDALLKAHSELVQLGIGYGGKLGFVSAPEESASFRSLAYQKKLVEKGASKTLYSNHRRGTAIDCAADWGYIKRIRPTMNKYGLFNDLAYIKGNRADDDQFAGSVPWDGGHWNWKSNVEAQTFGIIDALPVDLSEYKPGDVIDDSFAKKWAGYLVIVPELNGEVWYVSPKTLKRYKVGVVSADASLLARDGAWAGMSATDISKIQIAK